MTIVIQMADRDWTMQALHQACSLDHQTGSEIALVHMISAQRVGWLGTELGRSTLTAQERADLDAYYITAEDYGVEMYLQPMQYISLTDALVQVAEQLHARIIYAMLPNSVIPFQRSFDKWRLTQRLEKVGCALHTLEGSTTVMTLPGSRPQVAH